MGTDGRLAVLRERATAGGEESLPLGLTLVSAAVAAAVVSPLVWLVLRAADVGLPRAADLVFRPANADVLLTTLALVGLVTAGSVALGVPLAWVTVKTDLPFRRFWTVALALPLVVPSYIGAFAFVSAFGPHGELADALAPLGIESLPTVYGLTGTAFVLTLYVYPYVFITTRASLLNVDPTLVEAARTLNHDRLGAFRRVTLPRILPGIAAGALLVALYTLSDFGTPAIMHTEVFTQQIFVAYRTFARDQAALLSLQLLAVTALVLGLESHLGAGGDRTAYATRGAGPRDRIALGWTALPVSLACLAVAGLALVTPVAILVMWLERGGTGYAGGGFSFEWLFALNSVYVALLTALAAVVVGLPVAYLAGRHDSRLAGLFERATYVGYAVPGVVLGLALVYFGASLVPALYQTVPLLVFAYVVRFLPQAVGTTRSSVLQVDPKLTEAARTLGGSPVRAFRKITLPLIAPGLAAGAALVFLTTMKELPATLLLRPSGRGPVASALGVDGGPTGFETLVTYIWRVQEAGYYGQAAVPALVLVAVSAASMLVILARERSDG